jgi:ADP-ribosylation factor related protein 1
VGKVEVGSSKLVLWDLGGQLGLRSIWDKYYEESQGIVYVVDAANSERFQEAKTTLRTCYNGIQLILLVDSILRHPDLQGLPVLVFANKQDLSDAKTAREMQDILLGSEGTDRKIYVQSISALKGYVDVAYQLLIRKGWCCKWHELAG